VEGEAAVGVVDPGLLFAFELLVLKLLPHAATITHSATAVAVLKSPVVLIDPPLAQQQPAVRAAAMPTEA
jgi:hypothetical protein